MQDISQLGLEQLDPVDWDNLDAGGTGPAKLPDVKDVDGRNVVFYGQTPTEFEFGKTRKGSLSVTIDPIVLVNAGEFDGTEVRFTKVNSTQWTRLNKDSGQREPINMSSLIGYLNAAGIKLQGAVTDPNDYANAIDASGGKIVPFTAEWEAYDKENKISYRGFESFPMTESGSRRPTLKPGDTFEVKDRKGNVTETLEVLRPLRANLKVQFFQAQQ